MSQEDSDNVTNLKSISLHEGRLRTFIQFLKDKEATIRVDHDLYGKSNTTTYSSGKHTDHKLKELILGLWPEATDAAYYEYLKANFTTHRKTSKKIKQHHAYETFIKDIKCTFQENAHIDQREYKEQLFFSGARRQQTNVLAAFPNFRQNIIAEVKQFISLLESREKGFPYRELRNHTSHRCHRFKQLEKSIFQNFKDMDSSRLGKVRTGFTEVMSSYVKHLESLEDERVGHEQPDGKRILENRLKYQELSDPENIEFTSQEEQEITELGFKNAFTDKAAWFDELRFKKITYWKDKLSDLELSEWPPYFFEHILLAYFELNTVCSNIVAIRDQLFNEVGFYVSYSKDGRELFTIEEVLSPKELSTLFSNYEYQSNAFVDALRSDGNLLQKPLQRLPKHLEHFDKLAPHDNLFHSRIEKLIWEYLLYRMCDSCQLNREHVADFYTPLYKPY